MIINHNMMAINANRMANINSSNASKAMAKISSGLRINGAADDAAGLAISEKMKGQINGLDQASSNAQDAISMVQTAEGALNETTSVLQRLRTLAVQASNDTNTTTDREAIQTEATQLVAQIDNIADTTQFNTKNLLNGNCGLSTTIDAATGLSAIDGGHSGTGTFSVSSVVAGKTSEISITLGTGSSLDKAGTFEINGTAISVGGTGVSTDILNAINAETSETGVTASIDATGKLLTLTNTDVGSNSQIKLTDATNVFNAADGYKDMNGGGTDTTVHATETASGADATATGTGLGTGATISGSGDTLTVVGGTFDGLKFNVNANMSNGSGTITVNGNNSLTMQIGANSGQTMSISMNDMSSKSLGVNSIDLTTQTGAEKAIDSITAATTTVSTERAKLGAYQNRLESTINNLGTSSQNLTSAQSQIADVDMASEMAEFSKDNVLSQAAQAMLAQANQQPSQILTLLRG